MPKNVHAYASAPSASIKNEYRKVFSAFAATPSARIPHGPAHRNEAERMRLPMGRRDFFGAGFQLLKPASNRPCQWRLPSIADEPPGGTLSRHGPFQLPPGSVQRGYFSRWPHRSALRACPFGETVKVVFCTDGASWNPARRTSADARRRSRQEFARGGELHFAIYAFDVSFLAD